MHQRPQSSTNLMSKQQQENDLYVQEQEEEPQLQPFSVYVRIRPLLVKHRIRGAKAEARQPMLVRGQNQQILQVFENAEKAGSSSKYQEENESLSFLFDKVFSDDQTNLQVFQAALQPLIPQLLEGYNVSCFAYGMTGSGKTHTMLGGGGGRAQDAVYESEIDALQNLGLCNLAIQNLFYQMLMKEDEFTYTLSVSYVEIYNEKVRDLLADMKEYQSGANLRAHVKRLLGENHLLKAERGQAEQNSAFNMSKANIQKDSAAQSLKIVEDPIKGVQVQNLLEVPVAEASDLMDLIELGNQRRCVANTGANGFSSRSHAILIFNIEGLSKDESETRFTRSKLQIIDLAGSERAASTENRGQRMVEGAIINKSLLTLGQCINILSEQCKRGSQSSQLKRLASRSRSKGRKAGSHNSPSRLTQKGVQKFIPYRDSKLTRLLKDSLGGCTKTVMIACINQQMGTYEETMNTIKYASKAKSIQNKRVKNEIIQAEYALEVERQQQKQLQEAYEQKQREQAQIKSLKQEIERLRGSQSQVKEVAKIYMPPGESLNNSRQEITDVKVTNMTKLQQRKSHKKQSSKVGATNSVEELLTSSLVPNIVMQYNLRQQIQSHNILKEMQGHYQEDEVGELQQDLVKTQNQQQSIHLQIIQLFAAQQSQIQMLQRQVENAPSKGLADYAEAQDEIQRLTKENQVLKLREHQASEEIGELKAAITELSSELHQRDQLIDEQEDTESVYQEKINRQQLKVLNLEKQVQMQQQVILQGKELQAHLEQQLHSKSQQLSLLQDERGVALQKVTKKQTFPSAAKEGVNYELASIEPNSCLNMSDQINTTLEQSDFRPPKVTKPIPSKEESRNTRAEKKSSKETLKKQKSLKRYLSGVSKEPREGATAESRSNALKQRKEERIDEATAQLAKSRSHFDFDATINGNKENVLDLRNQKFKKMENQIFGELGALESLTASAQYQRMRTVQLGQEKEQPAYPKLRQSANNAKFQKNLRPRSHSRLSRKSQCKSTTSKSNLRKSLQRCHTNMDVIQPTNQLTLGPNHNQENHVGAEQRTPHQYWEAGTDSLRHFQLPNIMNVSSISMEFNTGDENPRTEMRNYSRRPTDLDDGAAMKQETPNPFFNLEDSEGLQILGQRDLFHSKSALATIVPGFGELATPEAKMDTRFTPIQHSGAGSGVLVSLESSVGRLNEQSEAHRNGQARAPQVKDLINYAEVRQQSKDRRKQQNAVKNLALNFQKFKTSQDESQKNMRTQMFIVDSIKHEIQKSQNARQQIHNNEGYSVPLNEQESQEEVRSQQESEHDLEEENPTTRLQQFVEDNNKKMQEIQQIAEDIGQRSLERSIERANSLEKLRNERDAQLQQKNKVKTHKFDLNRMDQDINQDSSSQNSTELKDREQGHQNRHNYLYIDEERSNQHQSARLQISPQPIRKPNFHVPEYQTEMGCKISGKASQRSNNVNAQSTGNKGTNRSHNSKKSDSSQIFRNFEKTAQLVRDSLNHSPLNFAQRKVMHQGKTFGQGNNLTSSQSPQTFQVLQFQDERLKRNNHIQSMDFQSSAQNTRMAHYFQMGISNSKSLKTQQTSVADQAPLALHNEAPLLDDSQEIQSVEKFRDLQRQISNKYIAKAFGQNNKSKRRDGSKSLSKTPDRSRFNAHNDEFSRNDRKLAHHTQQTQEKHNLKQYIQHEPVGHLRMTVDNQIFSPYSKAGFHLNLDGLNLRAERRENEDTITDSQRVKQNIQSPNNEKLNQSQASSVSDRYLRE